MRLTLLAAAALSGADEWFDPGHEVEAKGVAAFRAAAARLGGAAVVLRSPAVAAAHCATAAGLAAYADEALRDRDYGVWSGCQLEAVATADPGLFGRWLADADAAPTGGESVQDLVIRAEEWLAGLADARHVVAITHPAVIRACLAAVLGSPRLWFGFDVGHVTRTVVTRHGGRWRIALVNAPL